MWGGLDEGFVAFFMGKDRKTGGGELKNVTRPRQVRTSSADKSLRSTLIIRGGTCGVSFKRIEATQATNHLQDSETDRRILSCVRLLPGKGCALAGDH